MLKGWPSYFVCGCFDYLFACLFVCACVCVVVVWLGVVLLLCVCCCCCFEGWAAAF